MKKKLDTRFPAARIKKIIQADEDVGKIAMVVPVLVSKALELFLQDLCDRTYDITVQRGAKTVSALHLKHCVHGYNVFDFLKEVVAKVPDYGNSDSATDMSKRRKVELNDSDEEAKRTNMHETCQPSGSGRGRGKGRGRGRPSRVTERETPRPEVESVSPTQPKSIKVIFSVDRPVENKSDLKESPKENIKVDDITPSDSKNFDLNTRGDEDSDKLAPASVAAPDCGPSDVKDDDYPGLSEMDRMAIDPVHLAPLSSRLDEDEEDYDNEW